MSTYPPQPGQPQTYYYQPPPTNALGIAGFVVSLSGMIVCLGLTCPLGLVLSLIALAKSPRGYAIAGSIVGALGSVLGVLTALVFTGVIGTGLFGNPYYSHTANEIDNASYDINSHFQNNQDTLPDQATGNMLISSYDDEWNNNLKYEPTPGSTTDYTITSAGPDTVFNTIDDITHFYTAESQTDLAMEFASWEIEDYVNRNGQLPESPQGTALIQSERDTWGNALKYDKLAGSAQDYRLASAGPDGQFNTPDDIVQTFATYQNFGNPLPPDISIDLEQDKIDAAFELAAQKIVKSFPVGAPMPNAEQVNTKAGVLFDAWLTPMEYAPTDNPPYYNLHSAGPDQQWGTDDDQTRSYYFAPSGETDGPL
ncbi:MAG: hypothetical protein KTR15_07305 [Phycisphaeraceae bacterium]|nr:hypothetical protein [Phycisphaeraceae bacterium]